MSARRFDHDPLPVRRNDVIGQDSEGVPEFVRHAALSADEHARVTSSVTLPLTDMGPPLERRGEARLVHVYGSVPLTADEVAQIDLFVDRMAAEYEAARASPIRQYVVHPHCCPFSAEGDETVLYYRYSCGGFVLEAYRFAGIDLLVTDEASLPQIELATLHLAYPDQRRALDLPRTRDSLGLRGLGPWPVLLAGYLLNALNRSEPEIRLAPYRARPGDEFFPRHPPPSLDDKAA